MHPAASDQVDAAGTVVEEGAQFQPQRSYDATPVLFPLHLQDLGAHFLDGEADAGLVFPALGLTIQPRVLDGDGHLVEHRPHGLDPLLNRGPHLGQTACGQDGDNTRAAFDRNEVTDSFPLRGNLHAGIKPRIVSRGDDEFTRPGDLRHDVRVIEIVA